MSSEFHQIKENCPLFIYKTELDQIYERCKYFRAWETII